MWSISIAAIWSYLADLISFGPLSSALGMNDINSEIIGEIRELRRLTTWLLIVVPIALFAALGVGFWFGAHRSTPKLVNNPEYVPAARTRLPAVISSGIPAVIDKSIAVLPFRDVSPDRQKSDVADAVQRQVLSKLAQLADLRVISSGSVMQQKTVLTRSRRDVGQQLGVAYLLEGSVRRAGSRVSVSVQLIDAERDETIWDERYESELTNVFGVGSDIAKAVADQLGVKPSLTGR
jgi:TolB-like protein